MKQGGAMMMPIEHFWSLCGEAKVVCETTVDSRQREPALSAILTFVKDRPQYRDKFAYCFMHLFHWPELGPFDIIEYCMADLRWQEVYQYLEGIEAVTPEINCRYIANRILSAFKDPWPTGVIYERFARTTHPTVNLER
jgi:hypothetical protein